MSLSLIVLLCARLLKAKSFDRQMSYVASQTNITTTASSTTNKKEECRRFIDLIDVVI